MPPAFIYFDLGNVLLYFSHEQGCRQMAEVSGVAPEVVRSLIFESGLLNQCERGELTNSELFEIFCEKTGTRPDYGQLQEAGNSIFTCNRSILPLIGHLQLAGHRLGILSNIGESHWNYVSGGRYGILPQSFEVCVLSYQVGAMKPDPKIFQHAAERAGVTPQEIFYTDDRADLVAAAQQAGFDAVQYTSTHKLAVELRKRGVRSNF